MLGTTRGSSLCKGPEAGKVPRWRRWNSWSRFSRESQAGEVMGLQKQVGPQMLVSGLGLVLGLLGSPRGSGSRGRIRSALGEERHLGGHERTQE